MHTETLEPRLGEQRWSRHDGLILGGLFVIALIAVGLGFAGATRIQPVAGLAVILALAYCLSSARRSIDYRTVGWGLALQFLFALIVLKTNAGRLVFQTLGGYITKLLNFTYVGSAFVFGPLGDPKVWPRAMINVFGPEGVQYGTIFAFQVLPTII